MKLLTELYETVEYITEEVNGGKRTFIKGIFAEAEVLNRNKRMYPMPILEREITRYTKENISTNSAYGELNHPDGPGINLDRACILIKEMNKDGNAFIGKALVTSTPMGKIVEGLIADGARLGVSTRALGSLQPIKEGVNEGSFLVRPDLRLLAVDVVADPSAPNAFVNGILEDREYIYDASKNIFVEEFLDETKKVLKNMDQKRVDEAKLAMFQEFLDKLAS
jgi:hypothetical protein